MNIVEALDKHNMTISTAESLTAGLVASDICMISGASKWYRGGIVSYTKEMKCELLGLSMDNINKYGVYSFNTVEAMAIGIQKRTNSDIAVATSGVAGPYDDEGVEAGSVYFCIRIGKENNFFFEKFRGSRNEVRESAALFAVNKVISLLEKNS